MKAARDSAKKPAEFLRTTGVNYITFTIFLGKVEAHVKQLKEQNHIPKRGRKGSLNLSQMLLTQVYMRQYHNFLSLGQAFSVRESYAYKRDCYIRSLVLKYNVTAPATIAFAPSISIWQTFTQAAG